MDSASMKYSDFDVSVETDDFSVHPCFCFKMQNIPFFKFVNSLYILSSIITMVVSLIMIFSASFFFINVSIFVISLVYMMTSIISLIKYAKYKTCGLKFHKWQAIINFMMSWILIFIMGIFFLVVLVDYFSESASKISDDTSFINTYLLYLILTPIFLFNIYWSYLLMQVVIFERTIHLKQDTETEIEE